LPPDDPQSSCKLKRISDDIMIKIGNHYSELNLDGEHVSKKLSVSGNSERDKGVTNGQKDLTKEIEFNEMSISKEVQADEMTSDSDWRPLERDLYLKGVEMFGKNRYGVFSLLKNTWIMLNN